MEPLDPDVPVGPASPTGLTGLTGLRSLTLPLSAAAAALLFITTGDGLLAAVLIGLAAADALTGAIAAAAVLGTLARFGSTSLAGIAGAQAVLGPAVAVRPAIGALGSALLALSCIATAPPTAPVAVPLALLAGVVAVGPSATSLPDAALRVLGMGAALGLVWMKRRLRPIPAWAAPAMAAAGLALTVLA